MPVFTADGSTFTGFDASSPYIGAGQTLTAGGTAGNPGAAFTYGLTTASTETGMRADFRTSSVRNYSFDVKIDATATIATTGDHTICHIWNDSYADFLELRMESLNSGANFRFKFVETTGYTTIMTIPDVLSKGIWYTVKVQITDTVISLRLNGRLAGRLKGRTQTGINMGVVTFGTFYTSFLTGTMYIDNVIIDTNVAPTAATTDTTKLAAVYQQYVTNHVRADGCPIRPFPDGVDGVFAPWSDSTSETVSYLMIQAVQMNDKTTFDLVATWAYNNMRRGAQAIGTVPNLYSWHWNIENNTAYDTNTAHDGDLDIMKAYYWAHARYGSAGTINYLSRANAMSADLVSQFTTNGTSKYLPSDFVQGSTNPYELNVSYFDPTAFELAKKYDSTNSIAWGQAITGMYEILAANRDYIYLPQLSSAGLPADWGTWGTTNKTWATGGRTNPDRYAYEAFRIMFRIKEHYDNYQFASAATVYATAKTFLTNYWTANSVIKAEYNHDGNVAGNYEANIFTYAATQVMKINDASNATAAAIYTAKLANMYASTVEGHIYQDAPSSGEYAYYNQSWLILDEMERQGAYTNFGGASSQNNLLLLGVG